ncbi:MAG: Na+/H+ antiporter subunit E [Woeseiaceae bacterium]
MNTGTTANQPSGRAWLRMLVLGLLLIAAWLLWSGFFKALLLGLGAVSCVLTLYIVRRMGYFDDETFAFNYDFRLLGFWAWLGKEIVKSSLEVAQIVLQPKIVVTPSIVDIDASDLHVVDQVLLGNSITLTPGTLTLDVHEGRLLVHALTADGAAAVAQGEMKRRVAALRNR